MTFNSNARIKPGRVERRGRSAGAAGMAGGGGVGMLILALVALFFGVDLFGGGGGGVSNPVGVQADPAAQADYDARCQTGDDANKYDDCRVGFTVAALDDYWSSAAPAVGADFTRPGLVIFDGTTPTPCGTASSQTGPFYCPPDQKIYVDPAFFALLRQNFGAGDAPLAQLYIIAHEYGHHIQNEVGIFGITDRGATGANSDAVDVELMADCLAGVWLNHATSTKDEYGTPFLEPFTKKQIESALAAASAVGDDNIQQVMEGQVTPHNFTHGTSEQRVAAVESGMAHGQPAQCDRFDVMSHSGTF